MKNTTLESKKQNAVKGVIVERGKIWKGLVAGFLVALILMVGGLSINDDGIRFIKHGSTITMDEKLDWLRDEVNHKYMFSDAEVKSAIVDDIFAKGVLYHDDYTETVTGVVFTGYSNLHYEIELNYL